MIFQASHLDIHFSTTSLLCGGGLKTEPFFVVSRACVRACGVCACACACVCVCVCVCDWFRGVVLAALSSIAGRERVGCLTVIILCLSVLYVSSSRFHVFFYDIWLWHFLVKRGCIFKQISGSS